MAPENEKGEGTDNEKLFDKYWHAEEEKGFKEKPDSETIYNKLKSEIFPPVTSSTISINKNRRWIGYAASILLIAAGSFWFGKYKLNQPSRNENSTVSISTKKGETKILGLPDSSKIKLFENSTISYSSFYGSTSLRQVKLNGDASFKVIHNKNKPFVLVAGVLTIKDIGTVFKVTMNNKVNKGVAVSVIEGSVSIQGRYTTNHEVILIKGDEAIYNFEKDKLTINNSTTTKPKNKRTLEFNEATIDDVLKKISDSYGVKLSVEGTKSTKMYTGTFENENIDDVLDMIGFTLNFKHYRKDDTILISFYGNEK